MAASLSMPTTSAWHAEIEQLWIDFKIHDKFNWRSPGVDLVPIGYINQRHEPTQFYSVNRPELYNGLIPSTFMVPATSIYGRLMDGLSYQIQASSSVEDFGDDFDKRTDANSVPLGGYAAGITGLSALHDSRPVVGDFRQLNNTIAYAGKLDFAPPFVPGFAGSVSGYFSPNITPRGAYADTGATLGRNSLALFDAEFRYRVPSTGLELRGEYVRASFGNPPICAPTTTATRPTMSASRCSAGPARSPTISSSAPSSTANGRRFRSIATPTRTANQRVCRNRRQRAHGRRPLAVLHGGHRGLSVAESRAQGDLPEGEEQGSGRRQFGFGARRRRVLF